VEDKKQPAIVDARGRMCPIPLLLVQRAMRSLRPGQEIQVLSDDKAFGEDLAAWCAHAHHTVVSVESRDGIVVAVLRRGLRD
jgi:tRNA 2-thiouridine synthesizing protein A